MNHGLKCVTIGILALLLENIIPEALGQPGMPGSMRERMAMVQSLANHRRLKSIAYGNGIFVAVGPSLTILSSKDGVDWSERSSEINNVAANINFTTQTYSAGGDTITFAIMEQIPKPPQLAGVAASSKTETNPAVFNDRIESNRLAISNYSAKFPKISHQLNSVAFGAGTFVIVGDLGEILISHDGEHWTTRDSGTSGILTGVAYGQPGFVAVGDYGTILTSPDGLNWTRGNSTVEQTLFGVAYGNKTFVVVGDDSVILTSSNGLGWTSTDIGSEAMESIAFGNGLFIATSIDTDFPGKMYLDSHQTMASSDGKNWYPVKHPYPPLEGQVGAMTFDGHSGGTT